MFHQLLQNGLEWDTHRGATLVPAALLLVISTIVLVMQEEANVC
jgi:hypothetical protein